MVDFDRTYASVQIPRFSENFRQRLSRSYGVGAHFTPPPKYDFMSYATISEIGWGGPHPKKCSARRAGYQDANGSWFWASWGGALDPPISENVPYHGIVCRQVGPLLELLRVPIFLPNLADFDPILSQLPIHI